MLRSLASSTTFGLLFINIILVFSLIITNVNHFDKPSSHHSITTDKEFLNPFEVFKQRPIDIHNASAIFNTVHSALKEKDSNLKPNGVSFIPAYIPPNTRFYHSTGSPNIPSLFEWIAMDYEFSYAFATDRIKKKLNKRSNEHSKQSPLSAPIHHSQLPFLETAYLFTFRTTKPLTKLIFLDGASAAKSSPKMDQQMILSRQQNTTERVNEREAADKICKWGKKYGLDGIIRLEVGFEIIICDFHKDLELISNITLNSPYDLLDFPKETDDYDEINGKKSIDLSEQRTEVLHNLSSFSSWEWIKAGAKSDTGEKKILLDFSGMVTPLNMTYIDPNPFKRNISYISTNLKDNIIQQLENNLGSPVFPFDKTNWQVITNDIVYKFSPLLSLLNATMNNFDIEQDLKSLGTEIITWTYNFMRRYSDETIEDRELKRQSALELCILDYVYHTFPLIGTDLLIYSSIFKIQYEITTVIFDFFEFGKQLVDTYYTAPISNNNTVEDTINPSKRANLLKQDLYKLLETLNWSSFYECDKKCNFDEVCYTPTWGPSPFGWGPGTNHHGTVTRNVSWFQDNGEFYSIGNQLKCVNYRDVLTYKNGN